MPDELVTRVVQRFVMASFRHAVDLEAPPPSLEQRDTRKILSRLKSGVALALKGLDHAQAAERQALMALQRSVALYDPEQVPTLRVEQEIQFHALLATKHLGGDWDAQTIHEDAKDLSRLMAVTG